MSILLAAYLLSACSRAEQLPATPPPETWFAYQNRWFAYEIRYPPDSSLVETIGGASTIIYLHAGTEAFSVSDDMVLLSAGHTGCQSLGRIAQPALAGQPVTVGEVKFLRRQGSAGRTTWESYSVERDGLCLTITYSTRLVEAGPGETPQAAVSQADVYSIFQGMLASLRWIDQE